MPWKEVLINIFKSKELCLPFCIFIFTGLNPIATAIIFYQAALLRAYRKRHQGKLKLTKEEKIELAQFAILIPKEWLERWAPEFKLDTIKRWIKNLVKTKYDYSNRKKKVGRPPKSILIEKFVIRACRDNPAWGDQTIADNASRIYGKVSDTTILRIRRKHNIPPSIERKKSNWTTFKDCGKIWGTDLFKREVFTQYGLMTYYVLIFVHWKTRELIIAGTTQNPSSKWVEKHIQDLDFDDRFSDAKYIVRDNDTIYSKSVDNLFKKINLETVTTAIKAPKMNAHTERCIRTIKSCFKGEVSWGELSFRRSFRKIEIYYNTERHHQALNENSIPFPSELSKGKKGRVKRLIRCNGAQSFYFRKSA